jgi:hypothetical protein
MRLPGAPKKSAAGFDPVAVLDWIARSSTSLKTLTSVAPEIRELRAEQMRVAIDRARFALERERDQYVRKSEASQALTTIAEATKRLFYQRLKEIAPKLQGCDAVVITDKLLNMANDVCLAIYTHGSASVLRPDAPPAPAPATPGPPATQ